MALAALIDLKIKIRYFSGLFVKPAMGHPAWRDLTVVRFMSTQVRVFKLLRLILKCIVEAEIYK